MKKTILSSGPLLPVAVICTMLVFSAWDYGGTTPLAIRGIVIASIASIILLFMTVDKSRIIRDRLDLFQLVAIIGIVGFIAVQVLNQSHTYSEIWGLAPVPHIKWLPTTVLRSATINSLLLVIAYAATYVTIRTTGGRRASIMLIGTAEISAVCMAMLALLQGSYHERWEPVGMFLNENNFSAYINLVFPVALGVAGFVRQRSKRLGQTSNPGVLLYFCAGIMAVSAMLSGSRAGAAITFITLFLWIIMGLRESHRSQQPDTNLFHIVIPIAAVTGLLLLFGVDIWHTELTKPGSDILPWIYTRLSVAHGTWQIFLDHPLYGIGAGGFRAAFPYYQDIDIQGFYRHAHNDWIQWAAELGIGGCVLAMAAVVPAFIPRRKKSSIDPGIARGMRLGILSVAIHAVVDFHRQ